MNLWLIFLLWFVFSLKKGGLHSIPRAKILATPLMSDGSQQTHSSKHQ